MGRTLDVFTLVYSLDVGWYSDCNDIMISPDILYALFWCCWIFVQLLTERLRGWVGVSGINQDWFSSCCLDQSFSVSCCPNMSLLPFAAVCLRVLPWVLIFGLYILPFHIINKLKVFLFHCCAHNIPLLLRAETQRPSQLLKIL